MGSPRFPEPPPSIPPTELLKIDQVVDKLAANKDAWVKLGTKARIAYLEKIADGVQREAEGWAKAGARAKGLSGHLEGEEWLAGPYGVARNTRLIIDALKAGGRPQPAGWKKAKNGQDIATVYPLNKLDGLLFPGITGEVWLEPGAEKTQGAIYRKQSEAGKVSLVLGAGNISCIGPMDVLHKLFHEDEVCILKMNPVNDYVGPFIERAFQCLIDDGFLGVVYGGAEVGKHLTNHDKVDTIHITGSAATHDAIIWGGDPDTQQKNKEAGTPVLDKPISSELGAVTPLLVVPGPWKDSDIAFQAKHVAGMVSHNASFDCNAIKAVVVASGWAQKDQFLDAIKKELAAAPPRRAYYPGAQQRYEKFLENYPQAEVVGQKGEEIVPFTVIPGVKPSRDEYALSNEAFCGVLAFTEVEADDAPTFLKEAVRVANEEIWGTLSCAMLCHPESERAHKGEVEQALCDLKYGGIGYNIWPGTLFGLVATTWGAFPGHPLEDIRSGRGVVHNSLMFDHPEKSVIRSTFIITPKPIWFTDHKRLAQIGEVLTRLERKPSFFGLPKVIRNALAG